MSLPFKYFLLVLLLPFASSASIRILQTDNSILKPFSTSIDLGAGTWKDILIGQPKLFPLYYICGAELNSYTLIVEEAYNCGRRWYRRRLRYRCNHRGVPAWTRSNGIRLQFCNAQNWNDQITKEKGSNWAWQGMKLCPSGQYMNGFTVKMDQNNGLNGLLIYCQTISGNASSQILVKDGFGNWYPPVKAHRGQLAYQFQLKYTDTLTGLSMGSALPISLTSINFDYNVPAANWIPFNFETQTFSNPNRKGINKVFTFNNSINIMQNHQNANNYLSAQALPLGAGFKISATALFAQSSDQTLSTRQFGYLATNASSSINFGNLIPRVVNASMEKTVYLLPCTIITAIETTQLADITIPYVATFTYQSLAGRYYVEKVNGNYYGKLSAPVSIDTSNSSSIVGCRLE